MSEYLKMLIAVPVVTGLFGIILPDGRLKKQARLVVSLVALLAVLLPMRGLAQIVTNGTLQDFISEIDTPAFSDEIDFSAEQLIVDETCRRVCGELEKRIFELYGLEDISIELICDTSDYGNVVIGKAVMHAGQKDGAAYRVRCSEAAKYVGELLGCGCEIEFAE